MAINFREPIEQTIVSTPFQLTDDHDGVKRTGEEHSRTGFAEARSLGMRACRRLPSNNSAATSKVCENGLSFAHFEIAGFFDREEGDGHIVSNEREPLAANAEAALSEVQLQPQRTSKLT